MLVVFLPIFMADAKIIFIYNFVVFSTKKRNKCNLKKKKVIANQQKVTNNE